MSRELKIIGEEYRKASNESFDSVVRSVGEINKSLVGIASEMTEHSKRSVGRAFEMQAQLAKKAYETYLSEITKLGQMIFAPWLLARAAERLPDSSFFEGGIDSRSGRQRTAAHRIGITRKTGVAKRRSRSRKHNPKSRGDH
jgi:hypothetical protein